MWNDIKRIDDVAQNVAKFVFKNDTAVAEAVLYKYPTYAERTVICCSTQSGCPMGCRFCGTGEYFVRSLSTEEIIDQVDHAIWETDTPSHQIQKLQIMFMSMGEPLLNLKNLIPALRVLYAKYPNASLLISTSAPDVDIADLMRVSKEIPTIGLQFSIHESTDEARDKLIPFKKKMNLDQITQTGSAWHALTGRKPFFNYCAHDGNSSVQDGARLYELFDPKVWNATVSVICEKSEGFAVSNQHQRDLAVNFGNLLLKFGFDVRVFDPAGQDTIGGGCGQLWFVQDWMRKNPGLAKKSVGHSLPSVHAPV